MRQKTNVLHFGVLDDEIAQFRVAVHDYLRSPDANLPALMQAISALAAAAQAGDARQAWPHAEHLVILVKQEWERAVQARGPGDTLEHQRLRQLLVTSVIKAYYLQ